MPPIQSRIDWLSFTMPVASAGTEWTWRAKAIRQEISRITSGVLSVMADELQAGRAPYWWSVSGVGIRVFFCGEGDVLVEISGDGCQILHESGAMAQLVRGWHFRLTRMDHATDILTETSPVDFAGRTGRKFRSKSVVSTPSGQTVYCGSLKSNRYVRVYRYAPPHPRSKFLRIESVFRHADAGLAARAWLDSGDDDFAARCGKIWKWQHPDWNLETRSKAIPAWVPDTKGGKTERWLLSQVAPAVRNGLQNGALNQQAARRFLMAIFTVNDLQDLISDLTLADAPSAER